MIEGIGVDIVEIVRIERIINSYNELFLNKIFTKKEIEYCKSKSRPAQHYAVRFAGKEAISKALGSGINGSLTFKDIEILNDKSGKPEVFIKSDFQHNIKISLSHSSKYAIAYAIYEK